MQATALLPKLLGTEGALRLRSLNLKPAPKMGAEQVALAADLKGSLHLILEACTPRTTQAREVTHALGAPRIPAKV